MNEDIDASGSCFSIAIDPNLEGQNLRNVPASTHHRNAPIERSVKDAKKYEQDQIQALNQIELDSEQETGEEELRRLDIVEYRNHGPRDRLPFCHPDLPDKTPWRCGMLGMPSVYEAFPPPQSQCIYPIRDGPRPARPPTPKTPVRAFQPAPLEVNGKIIYPAYVDILDPDLNGGMYTVVEALEYPGQYAYVRSIDLSTNHLLAERLRQVIPHKEQIGRPIICANGSIIWEYPDVPGQVEMIMGIPYAQADAADASCRETIGMALDEAAIRKLDDGKQILAWLEELYSITFGTSDQAGIWQTGLQRNDRSQSASDSASGSFSLAFTNVESGRGIIAAAVQTRTPEADRLRARALFLCSCIVPLVLFVALQKAEYDNLMACHHLLNPPTFGSAGNFACNAVQLNLSFFWLSLAAEIGAVQGKIHPDPNDKFVAWTVFILLLNTPPDVNPGGFIFPQAGLYTRFKPGQRFLILIFKGVDLHGALDSTNGRSLSKDDIDAMIKDNPPHRAGYVCFNKRQIGERTASLEFTPKQQCGPNTYPSQYRNMMSDDALIAFGGSQARQSEFIAAEFLRFDHNSRILTNPALLDLVDDIGDRYRTARTFNDTGQVVTGAIALRYHPIHDLNHIYDLAAWHCHRVAIAAKFHVTSRTRTIWRSMRAPNQIKSVLPEEVPSIIIQKKRPSSLEDSSAGLSTPTKRSRRLHMDGDACGQHLATGTSTMIEKAHTAPLKRFKKSEKPKSGNSKARTRTSVRSHDQKRQGYASEAVSVSTQTTLGSSHIISPEAPKQHETHAFPSIPMDCSAVGEVQEVLSVDNNDEEMGNNEEMGASISHYVVKRILTVSDDYDDEVIRANVQWDGYTSAHNTWENLDDLKGCPRVAQQYLDEEMAAELVDEVQNGTHPRIVRDFDPDREDSDIEDLDDYDADGRPLDVDASETANIAASWQARFPMDELTSELEEMQAMSAMLNKRPIPNLSKACGHLRDFYVHEHARRDDLQQIHKLGSTNTEQGLELRENGSIMGWTESIGRTMLLRVQDSTSALPSLAIALQSTEAIQQQLRLGVARAHIIVNELAFTDAPALGCQIFTQVLRRPKVPFDVEHFLQSGSLSDATQSELARYPLFEKILFHVLHFVRNSSAIKCWTSFSKGKAQFPVIPSMSVPFEFLKPLGIHPPPKSLLTFTIPLRKVNTSSLDYFQMSCVTAFVDILVHGVGLPYLRITDGKMTTDMDAFRAKTMLWKSAETQPDVLEQARLLARGLIYASIARNFGDGFFVFRAAHGLLQQSTIIHHAFPRTKDAVAALAPRMSRTTSTHYASFERALFLCAAQQPELVDMCAEASHASYRLFLQHIGEYNTVFNKPNHVEDGSHRAAEHLRTVAREDLLRDVMPQLPSLTREDGNAACITSLNVSIDFSLLSLVIEESIALARQEPPILPEGRRILEGLDPATGSRRVNAQLDHYQPIRKTWSMVDTLEKMFEPYDIASSKGLFWLMSFMAYGGSSLTSKFHLRAPHRPESVSEMLQKFDRAVADGIPVDNQRVWGTPCSHFQYNTSTARKRLELFWDTGRHWEAFLGSQYTGSNPSEWLAPPKTWREAISFVKNLKIPGFASGLTPFQLVNHLVHFGIVSPPKPDDVIAFMIIDGKSKGAVRGLEQLGFQLRKGKNNSLSYIAVARAFKLVNAHLEEHIPEVDQRFIVLDAIFTENSLCKLTRWSHVGRQMKRNATQKRGMWQGIKALARKRKPRNIPHAFSTRLSAKFLENRDVT